MQVAVTTGLPRITLSVRFYEHGAPGADNLLIFVGGTVRAHVCVPVADCLVCDTALERDYIAYRALASKIRRDASLRSMIGPCRATCWR